MTDRLQIAARVQVVQAAGDIDQTIHDQLGVAATIGGIHSMAGFEIAQRLEGGVIVAEGLDENGFEFSGFCGGKQGRADPSVVGAEAAACGFGRGMKHSHVVGCGEFGDEALVFLDGEAGVSHVSGIDQELEVIVSKLPIDRLDERPGALDIGEGLEFPGPEELDMP